MKNRSLIEALVVGIALTAISASAKAFLDISTLKINRINDKEVLLEIKEDIKFIRRNIFKYKQGE